MRSWLVFLLVPLSTATPVIRKPEVIAKELLGVVEHPDYCILPPDMGPGTLEFLEDCISLHQHPGKLPQPSWKRYGTHPLVCCPQLRKSSFLCFPSDPGCPSYKPPSPLEPQADRQLSEIEEYYSNGLQEPLMSDLQCSNTSQTCLPVAQCGDLSSGLLDSSLCGYDEASSQAMICCTTLAAPTPAPKPRFPEGGGGRRCEDRHSLCSTWASLGACSLNTHHRLITNSPDPTMQVSSRNMFLFMATTCPEMCGLCGAAGCRDDHPRCEEWAKSRQCTSSPEFMATVCRESCGVCGFLSPFNREEQEDKGLSYTDIDSPTFDCGRDPPFCVRDGFSCETGKPSPCLNLTREETLTTTEEPSLQANSLDLRDIFFAFTDFGSSYCSLIPITDKWALGAAHCYIDYSSTKLDPKGMTLNYGTEFEEDIEFKKVYRHPNYQAETLYNDVAVLEFGRRTLANVAKTNTTPDCIDPGIDLTKQDAFGEGFGQTACRQDDQKITLHQFGDVSKLFKVSLIENSQCERELNSLGQLEADKKKVLNKALPQGLTEDLVCSVGEKLPHGVFSGACKGDSGGAMKMRDPSGRQTLVGLVSGGLSCGQGEPGWNTRLAVHRAWISCIINSSRRNGGVYSRTLQACDHLAAGGQDGGEDLENLLFD